jgi:hypothetical protein
MADKEARLGRKLSQMINVGAIKLDEDWLPLSLQMYQVWGHQAASFRRCQ